MSQCHCKRNFLQCSRARMCLPIISLYKEAIIEVDLKTSSLCGTVLNWFVMSAFPSAKVIHALFGVSSSLLVLVNWKKPFCRAAFTKFIRCAFHGATVCPVLHLVNLVR